jgi:hypothetical protein
MSGLEIPVDQLIKRINKLMTDQATLIGQVVLEWNHMHDMIFHSFWQLSGMSREQAQAVFYALKADSAQRDITAALAKVRLSEYPDLQATFLTLIKQAGQLNGERNAAIHTTWTVSVPDYKIEPSPSAPPHGKLNVEEFEAQFRTLTRSLNQITFRLGEFCAEFARRRKASLKDAPSQT